MKSQISVGKSSAVEKQAVDNLGGTLMPWRLTMKSLCWQDTGMKKWFASAVKSACAACCVLVLFSYAAPAQTGPSITGFLVNGVAASSGPVGATLTIQG